MGEEYSPSSLKHRLKYSLCGCFKNNNNNNNPHHQHHQLHSDHRTLLRTSSVNASGMMRHLITRISTPRSSCGSHHHHHHHRKSKSTDFRYDHHSYTLNFDDDENAAFDEFPLRNFSARLPPSPPPHPLAHSSSPQPPPSSAREITACS